VITITKGPLVITVTIIPTIHVVEQEGDTPSKHAPMWEDMFDSR
jgi:hypothetical protein